MGRNWGEGVKQRGGYWGGSGLCRRDRAALAWQLQELSCEVLVTPFWKGCMSYFITMTGVKTANRES